MRLDRFSSAWSGAMELGTMISGAVFEPLEDRKLLTTLVGGDVFEFTDARGQTVRVSVGGNTVLELIGAADLGGTLVLGDMPGQFTSSDVGRTGYRFLLDGVQRIGDTPINDPISPGGSGSLGVPDAQNLINIEALASRADGTTYGFTLVKDGQGVTQIVQLLQVDPLTGNATAISTLEAVLPTTPVGNPPVDQSDVKYISASAFDPVSGLLYFAVGVDVGAGVLIDQLWSVDVDAGNAGAIAASAAQAAAGFGEGAQDTRRVEAMTFDRSGGASRLVAYVVEGTVGRLLSIDPASPAPPGSLSVIQFGGADVVGVTGLALAGDNPAAFDTDFFAVTNAGADSRLLMVDSITGTAVNYGLLRDGTDTVSPFRGQGLESLTWNPNAIDPFTGELGALLATDSATDELVAVDYRFRGINEAFTLYVSQSDIDSTLSVVVLDGNGDPQLVGSAAGSQFAAAAGGVYLGGRLLANGQPTTPVIEGTLADRLGVRAAGVNDGLAGGNVSAGFIVAPGLLDYLSTQAQLSDRLLGSNIDRVHALAIKRDITAADAFILFDTDGFDTLGNAVGDQIVRIDPLTAAAGLILDVTDGINPLSGVLAAGYGDATFTGVQTLYAVYDIGGTLTLGSVDTDTGVFTAITALDGAIGGVGAIAFAPFAGNVDPARQALYLADDAGVLYEIDPLTGNIVGAGSQLIDDAADPVAVKSMAFDRDGNLLLQDLGLARLVDVELAGLGLGDIQVGQNVATEPGSLRPTVGAIAYDFGNDRFLAVDNATSDLFLGAADEAATPGESAAVMVLKGITGDTVQAQHFGTYILGGVETGRVLTSGSLDFHYAGLVLTGDSDGPTVGGSVLYPMNFQVAGDLRDLYVATHAGATAEPNGSTATGQSGLDLYVGGRLGQMDIAGSLVGAMTVRDLENAPGLGENDRLQLERETAVDIDGLDLSAVVGNGSIDTAQHLGSIVAVDPADPDVVHVSGRHDFSAGDTIDYYAVHLLAGQTITTQLVFDPVTVFLGVGVIDPDGRLIATSYPDQGGSALDPFTFTADRPGQYSFAVAQWGDINFNGVDDASDPDETVLQNQVNAAYELIVTGVGSLALGAVDVAGAYMTNTVGADSVVVDRNDLGGFLVAGSAIFATDPIGALHEFDVRVSAGSLRDLRSGTLGTISLVTGLQTQAPSISVTGKIGYLQGTVADGLFALDAVRAGDDIQVIDAAGEFAGHVISNKALGVFRAASLPYIRYTGSTDLGFYVTSFRVNADDIGADGVIDLIDVPGSVGDLQQGGPAITTGTGGNVRYAKLAYEEGAELFQDRFFQSSAYLPLELAAGESYTHVDDGGGRFTITPGRYTSAGDPTAEPPVPAGLASGALTISSYGVRGSGGGVLLSVTSSNGGLTFDSVSGGPTGGIEVTRVIAEGEGRGLVIDPDTGALVADPDVTDEIDVIFRGALRTDVFEVLGAADGSGNLADVQNLTAGGEIVNLHAASVLNLLSHGTLGLARNSTAAAVLPEALLATSTLADAYPFKDPRLGVIVAEGLLSAKAYRGLGNFMVEGDIGSLSANADGVDAAGEFEGINAPVASLGSIFTVQIGEGVGPVGSGEFAQSGVFAAGLVGTVTNQGVGSDILGAVVGSAGVRSISLSNGSLLGAKVLSVEQTNWIAASSLGYVAFATGPIGQISLSGSGGIIGTVVQAGQLPYVPLVGTTIPVGIGNVTVSRGFGILNSTFSVAGSGDIGNVTADGYGILNVALATGADLGNVTATGNGSILQPTSYSASARYSENFTTHPRFGFYLNASNDLHKALESIVGSAQTDVYVTDPEVGDRFTLTVSDGAGATASLTVIAASADPADVAAALADAWNDAAPTNPLFAASTAVDNFDGSLSIFADRDNAAVLLSGRTVNGGAANTQNLRVSSNRQSGLIHFVTAQGNNTVGNISAYRIDNALFNFANGTGGVTTKASVDADPVTLRDVQLTTGRLAFLNAGGDVENLTATVAGPAGLVTVRGNLLGGSTISTVGPNGTIAGVNIFGDLDGVISASGSVRTVTVGGDVNGNITVLGLNVARGNAVHTITLRGDLNGGIDVTGSVGSIVSFGSLGAPGDILRITGDLGLLQVGSASSAAPSSLALSVFVQGSLARLLVVGTIDGSVNVGGDLGGLDVKAHRLTPAGTSLVNGDVTVGRDLKKASVTGGHVGDGIAAVSVAAGRHILAFSITGGDLSANASVASLLGDVRTFSIRNGDLLGDLTADHGAINSLSVTGSDLEGLITAASGGSFNIAGDVRNGGGFDIAGAVKSITVGGDVADTAFGIVVGSLPRLSVRGDLAALVQIGFSATASTLAIGGDWTVTGDSRIASNATVTVAGSLTRDGNATLSFLRDLLGLTVTGNVASDIFVDGQARTVRISGTMLDTVLTTAFDLASLSVGGSIANSLVQVGISRGDDGLFADTAAGRDRGETSRVATLGAFKSGTVTDSIIAAGGTIKSFTSGTMNNASASAGFSVGSLALRAVLDDPTRLTADPDPLLDEVHLARAGDDRAVLNGDIATAAIGGNGLIDSFLSAGVNPLDPDAAPGTPADFSAPSVLASAGTGGSSRLGTVRGILGPGSRLVSDAPIQRNSTTPNGGTVTQGNDPGVTYSIDNLTTDLGSPLPVLLDTATPGAAGTFTFDDLVLGTLTIKVTGPAGVAVDLHDADLSDGLIDALVVRGGNASTTVTVLNANYDIGRLLTADDSTVGTLKIDGDLVGDGTDAPDLWIDGAMKALVFRDLGDDVAGNIGGAVDAMTLRNQGAGRLLVGGPLKTLKIASGNTSSLFTELGGYANLSVNVVTVDAAGNVWVHENGNLHRIDPTLDAPAGILETVALIDAYSGSTPLLLGGDFLGASIHAIARLYDPTPNQIVGEIGIANADLRGLAVNAAGDAYAVDSSTGVDRLVRIDTLTGAATVVGTLRNPIGSTTFNQHVLAMSFDNAGRLIALVSDRDGLGPDAAGVALVEVQTTAAAGFVDVSRVGNPALKGLSIDGGTNQPFTGLAVAADDTLYAIRQTGGLQDDLVTIDPTTGAITVLGGVAIDGGPAGTTESHGIGIDENGNLLLLDNDGVSARVLYLSAADLALGDASNFQILGSDSVDPDTAAFAVGRSGVHYRTYAYDTSGTGTLLANPFDTLDAEGRVGVLGVIDTATGEFARLRTLADNSGTPVSVAAIDRLALAADNDGSGNIFVADADGRLLEYDVAGDSFTLIGTLTDAHGQGVVVDSIEFLGARLVGIDPAMRKLVGIDPATADVTSASVPGAFPVGLTDIGFDPVTGQTLGFLPGQNPADNAVVLLRGLDGSFGGIYVSGPLTTLTIADDFAGAIGVDGPLLSTATLTGDFTGLITVTGSLATFRQTGANHGTVLAYQDIGSATLTGDASAAALLVAADQLRTLNQSGDFDGTLAAEIVTTLTFRADLSGIVTLGGDAGAVAISGDLSGTIDAGSLRSLSVRGLTQDEAAIDIAGALTTLTLTGGTSAGSTAIVGGSLGAATVGDVHRGLLAAMLGAKTITLREVNDGVVVIGLDTDRLGVTGNVLDGLFSFGTWIGDDGVYNTADDQITGGTLKAGSFSRDFIDSVVAAGVLPSVLVGPGVPADLREYLGYSAGGTLIDRAEAGGPLPSVLTALTFSRPVFSSVPNGARQALAVAADGIVKLNTPLTTGGLATRVYGDPIGAPTVVSAVAVAGGPIVLTFSERLDTASLVLAAAADDTDASIFVLDAGPAVPVGLSLTYSEQTQADGSVRGIVSIGRVGGFAAGTYDVTVKGVGDVVVYDRSGLRSALRQLNIDPLGSVLDGNADGLEGDDFTDQVTF